MTPTDRLAELMHITDYGDPEDSSAAVAEAVAIARRFEAERNDAFAAITAKDDYIRNREARVKELERFWNEAHDKLLAYDQRVKERDAALAAKSRIENDYSVDLRKACAEAACWKRDHDMLAWRLHREEISNSVAMDRWRAKYNAEAEALRAERDEAIRIANLCLGDQHGGAKALIALEKKALSPRRQSETGNHDAETTRASGETGLGVTTARRVGGAGEGNIAGGAPKPPSSSPEPGRCSHRFEVREVCVWCGAIAVPVHAAGAEKAGHISTEGASKPDGAGAIAAVKPAPCPGHDFVGPEGQVRRYYCQYPDGCPSKGG